MNTRMVIRAQQMTALQLSTRDTFETRLCSHVEEFFPIHWREVGEEQVRGVIRLGIANAASYGMKTQREIYLFVSLMLYLGSSFDTDYQLPWAAASLNDMSETDPFTRIEKTYDAAVEYLDRVAGPNGQYSAAAIRRFTQMARDLSRNALEALPGKLGRIFPEKYSELSETQLNDLVREGRECALRCGLDAQQGAFLCTGLSFLLGYGYASDPQFLWAADVLNDSSISDPVQRVNAMKETSVLHLNRWLAATEQAK